MINERSELIVGLGTVVSSEGDHNAYPHDSSGCAFAIMGHPPRIVGMCSF